jgi:NarL family two-component system response regulator LiaR
MTDQGESDQPIRVLIVDDHEMVRAGIRAFLAPLPGVEIVGDAKDGLEGVALALSLKPDVILLDLVMPRLSGIDATRQIRQSNPNARILIITSYSDDENILAAIKAGAMGYLLKDSAPEDLLRAIKDIHRGQSPLHPTVARQLIQQITSPQSPDALPHDAPAPSLPIRPSSTIHSPPATVDPLSPREKEVLNLLAQGLSNQQIAEQLCLSVLTVRSHVSSVLHKLNLDSRTQAALYAVQAGLVDRNERG